MTSGELIAEGRRLQRPCAFLRTQINGPVAAIWHTETQQEILRAGHRCWLTVDLCQIPDAPACEPRYMTIITDEGDYQEDRVEVNQSWPKKRGLKLYAHPASVLPPLEVVFRFGSEAVGQWLTANGWERECRYNSNFKDKAVTGPYWEVFEQEFPMFSDSDVYAMLGGWHFPGQDDDWEGLIDEHLMILTFRDAEPWVEVWRTRVGQFRIIQRIT